MGTSEKVNRCGMCEHVWTARAAECCPNCDSDEIEAFADMDTDYLRGLWRRSVSLVLQVSAACRAELVRRGED